MATLRLPHSRFRALLLELTRNPGEMQRLPVAPSARTHGWEWVASRSAEPMHIYVQLVRALAVPFADVPDDLAGALFIGDGPLAGHVQGYARNQAGDMQPLAALYLVGPGMHRLPGSSPSATPPLGHMSRERWSRTIGALGGTKAWERLVSLHICLVGCGRTGSMLAMDLARLGVRHLTLVDPDVLEPHNLGEMDGVSANHLGKPKTKALSASLQREQPGIEVDTVRASATRLSTAHAIRNADLVISAVDADVARLAVAIDAALYGIPHVDVATGVLTGANGRRGADARLMLPGDCILCLGGLANETQAFALLSSVKAENQWYTQRSWQTERAGSLASLNRLAAGHALTMIQDLVAGSLLESTWIHVEYDGALPHVQNRHPDPDRAVCSLCSRLSGRADHGLRALPAWIEELIGRLPVS